MASVLKSRPGEASEERELEFELDYQRRLTCAERFEMMFRRSREMAEELLRRGHRRPVEVVKRAWRPLRARFPDVDSAWPTWVDP